ncbi:MAG: glycosyltransferase [Clostridiales bacterium]|jgi:processive 1,2-diacylglycerol beta-glucosyltransferase|nr:glycosyltransferase [Clostridiales bacterium]
MPKRILILTTKKGGHRGSSDAIKNAVFALNPDVDVNAADAMVCYPGYTGKDDEKGYVAFTTQFRFFWKLFYEFTSFFKGFSNFILYKTIFKRFKKMISEYKPDIILSVHPCFVGSVGKCLKKLKLKIPFYTCIIDPVKHSRLWHDKKCDITFVPTVKMYDELLKKGFKKENLVHSGFPINEKFSAVNKKPKTEISLPNVLMVSPSPKRDKVSLEFILAALKHNIILTVVTGSDEKLKKYLDKKLSGIENVTVLGYISDMDKRLSDADILIAKAGPNMILEAVKMCVPVLITGNILGQEEKNYQYIVENQYGLKCGSPKKLSAAMDLLFKNDYELLKRFSHIEQSCADISGAKVIAKYLVEN